MDGAHLQQVELEDDGEPDLPPARAARPAWLRVPRRWLVAGVVVAVAAVGVDQRVTTTREDAAVARLDDVPGVLAPVDADVTVGRRLPPDTLAVAPPTVGGDLRREADGSLEYRW